MPFPRPERLLLSPREPRCRERMPNSGPFMDSAVPGLSPAGQVPADVLRYRDAGMAENLANEVQRRALGEHQGGGRVPQLVRMPVTHRSQPHILNRPA